jgi:hypothetical protein
MRPENADPSRRKASFLAWIVVAIIFLLPAAVLGWMYYKDWLRACAQLSQLVPHGCEVARIVLVAASALGAFGIVILIW